MHDEPTAPLVTAQRLPPWRASGPDGPPRPATIDLTARPRRRLGQPSTTRLAAICLVTLLAVVLLALPNGPDAPARISLVVFLVAVSLWVGTRIDDTYVALAAALALVAAGVVDGEVLFAALGSETIWLLVAAFVVSAGVSATGLTTRCAVALLVRARSTRQLAHLVALVLLMTAFAVPATSARAALTLPVFTALARVLADRRRVVKALALLFPTVILLTAIATLIGAGAHLVTNEVLAATTGHEIGFARWVLLGVPLAAVSAHLAAEIVLRLFTTAADRSEPLRISRADIVADLSTPLTGPLHRSEIRALVMLALVLLAWVSEGVHGVPPALVALVGALLITSPQVGTTTMTAALRTVPWGLLVFMAATATLGAGLAGSGAADWLAGGLFGTLTSAPAWAVVLTVVVISVAAHLCLQSRTARSSVLVPLVVPIAVSSGLNPVALAFASTAAAGFCHTLTSSAKPVAMFADIDDIPTYEPKDLLRLSFWLGPLTALLVVACSLWLWPLLGLPLS